jgi:hypothetical protein
MGNGPFSGTTSRKLFESDHAFDNFASPTTNLFLFEDPRALTEVKPIFMYQTIPGSNDTLKGGNVNYLGGQARVAITERLSFVINKFGWISLNPTDQQGGPGSRSQCNRFQDVLQAQERCFWCIAGNQRNGPFRPVAHGWNRQAECRAPSAHQSKLADVCV